MLQTTDLQFSYAKNALMRFPDIQLQQGEHWLLLGESGSGKTTLLHLLGGLLSPSSGNICIAGVEIKKLSSTGLDRFRGQHIGIVFQKSHFIRSLTVMENLLLAQKLARTPIDKKRVTALLERLQLGHKLHSRPSTLSIGEQQRAAIARALVNHPNLILADEPTSALDDHNSTAVANLLEEEARSVGAMLLVVTHDKRLKDRFSQQIELPAL
jgi:putative ABC transport system ATP-binding protein